MPRRNNRQLRSRRNKAQHVRKRPLAGKKSWYRQSLKSKKFEPEAIELKVLQSLIGVCEELH